jgi:LacI family transcriptional regulator/LacI family repressor for deo operon, udp, cdd, tsx, nupC, and nupG
MVSIYDIARTANVSPSTVSRALQGNTRVGTATTARILAIAHELGYVPSSAARNLSTQRSNTIAVILSSIADPAIGAVVEGIERQAARQGYDILLAISHNQTGREQEIIATARQRRVDGIVLIASQMAARYNQLFDDLHIPTVVISEQELHDNVLVVRADDYASAQLATNHLLDLGHIRIGYLGVHDRPASQKPRVAGYYDALTARGLIPPEATWAASCPARPRAEAGPRRTSLPPRPGGATGAPPGSARSRRPPRAKTLCGTRRAG